MCLLLIMFTILAAILDAKHYDTLARKRLELMQIFLLHYAFFRSNQLIKGRNLQFYALFCR